MRWWSDDGSGEDNKGLSRRGSAPRCWGGWPGAAIAVDVLRNTLKPLGPLVQEVHDAVSAGPTPPNEVAVTFGVQLGQDLKLGIVNGNGQAHLTVTATWKPGDDAGAGS
ncbi:CU044_2847 family protein [Streptomyces sp. NPDC058576]|uniref:CU044_2847 family protein n=1 Tax=Streptomyces sp. NPDC058576 TaxID=3346547 RepID=UPI0036534531